MIKELHDWACKFPPYVAYFNQKLLENWDKNGRPVPPPHVYKVQTITGLGKRYGCTCLIETGTFHGEMVSTVRKKFADVYSVEIAEHLYKENRERFKNNCNVHLYLGDCLDTLPQMIKDAGEAKIIFWLDGHFSSGETGRGKIDDPIYESFELVFNELKGKSYAVCVDDALTFDGKNGSVTLETLLDFIKEQNPEYLEVKDNIIRFYIA